MASLPTAARRSFGPKNCNTRIGRSIPSDWRLRPAARPGATGSGKRRVGWHVAEALARRSFDLVVHYYTSAAEAERSAEHFRTFGVEAITARADLTDEVSVHGLVQAVLDRFGRLDVLVNCAA